ncbi:hypothetical protein ABES25_06005 [Bacillus gobiensis]
MMPKHIEILHTELATKNQVITVQKLSKKYGEHPEDILHLPNETRI